MTIPHAGGVSAEPAALRRGGLCLPPPARSFSSGQVATDPPENRAARRPSPAPGQAIAAETSRQWKSS